MAMTNPYIAGGKNKIIWGDEVTAGSSGGNTSYNPETGKTHYIQGYENDPVPTAATPTAQTSTSTKTSSTKPTAKTTTSAPTPKPAPKANTTAPAPLVPSIAPPPAAPTGALSGLSGAGPASEAGDGGGEFGLLGLGAETEAQQPVSFEPFLGPGLRAGLGQRAYPRMNAALAGLRKVY